MRTGLLPATYKTIKRPGMHSDGGNLFMQVRTDDDGNVRARSWIFRYQRGERVRDMGLGSVATITLVEARELAREQRKLLLQGLDPIEVRKAKVAQNLAATATVMTFDQAAESCMRQRRAGWKNLVHSRQWTSSLKTYVSPLIGSLPVQAIDTALVMKVIEPLWTAKPETASRLRNRIEIVLDWAAAAGYRSSENPNPARWKGHIANLLPARRKVATVQHMPSLPYSEMPSFMVELRERKGMGALALEFATLTAVRTADVLTAKHAHIDCSARTWTIPAFSKTGKEHRVALSTAAQAVFDKARKLVAQIGGDVACSEFAFPNDVTGAKLSVNAMSQVLTRMGRRGTMTVHGARASFRSWAMEQTSFPFEIAELALGHRVGDAVTRAYLRGDALRKRVALMQAWSDFLDRPQQPGSKIVPLRSRGA
jgi:integrase